MGLGVKKAVEIPFTVTQPLMWGQMTDLVLFRHNLLTVVDVEALLGFMVKRAAQQIQCQRFN